VPQEAILDALQFPAESVDEELSMTFQIALVATDGIILGSDRKIHVKSVEDKRAHFQFTEGDKIVFSRDNSVICGIAGGPQAQRLADKIAAEAKPDQSPANWRNSLRTLAELVKGNSQYDEVLVIRSNVPDIALVNRTGTDIGVLGINDRICTGIPATARFLIQHFWRPDPAELLKRLVLLALDYAAKERPSEVGFGFDLVIATDQVRQEAYYPDDPVIVSIREEFGYAVRRAIYESNS
jgi:hypothetical protein